MNRVLVVEDEVKIADLLVDYLRDGSFEARRVLRGDEALAAHAAFDSDLVVLDLQLPGLDGLSICRELQALVTPPAVMMLTARVDEIDRLLGLELGADDYVCKPFSPREVVARVRAILRRAAPSREATGEALSVGRLTLVPSSRKVTANGAALALTPIEFEILRALLSQPARVWARAQLLEKARGNAFEGYERNIDGHVKNLRRKLRAALDGDDPIRSVYGVGYGLCEPG